MGGLRFWDGRKKKENSDNLIFYRQKASFPPLGSSELCSHGLAAAAPFKPLNEKNHLHTR